MRLTIIPVDGAVYKNGISYAHLTWDGTPSNIHALQWFDSNTGWIEFNDGTPQENIDALPDWANNAMQAWTVASMPVDPTPEQIQAANSAQAQFLLLSSDFTQLPDVNLTNKADWATYRSQVRAIASNPPTTIATFPAEPPLNWAAV
jgi:hypothetical protein